MCVLLISINQINEQKSTNITKLIVRDDGFLARIQPDLPTVTQNKSDAIVRKSGQNSVIARNSGHSGALK